MKKKFIVIGVLLLAITILALWAVPVFAADSANPAPSKQNIAQGEKIGILIRLLVVQNPAKVDAFLAKAQDAGKLTADQAAKVKEIWTNHHEQFKPGSALVRLLKAKDGDKVKQVLDKGVTAKKITQQQADKVLNLWGKLHQK